MNPSLLRHRITVQRSTISKNEYSEEVETWTTVGTYWAQVEASPGKQVLKGDTPVTETVYTITCRYGADVQNKDRIVFGGNTLSVDGSADKLGTRKYIEIKAS